jgi:hypothetical protein
MSTPAYEWEEEYECEGGACLGGAPTLREVAHEAAAAALEALHEGEWESAEGEWELNPVRKVYPDAALEHLVHVAMAAESEAEAAARMRPVVHMAARRVIPAAARALPAVRHALPRVTAAVSRAAPHLTRGVARLAGTLHRNPNTRVLLRAVPTIARRTIGTLARQVAHGARLTPRMAVRTLARQTAGVLSHPHHVRRILRRSRALDRVYHRGVGYPAFGRVRRYPGYAPGVVHYHPGCPHCRAGVPHAAHPAAPALAPRAPVYAPAPAYAPAPVYAPAPAYAPASVGYRPGAAPVARRAGGCGGCCCCRCCGRP